MSEVKNGDKVKVHYTGKLEDGTVFDSSQGKDPLEFTVGDGKIIPGFEEGIIGMKVGESKKVDINSDNAYGSHQDNLIVKIGRDKLPSDIEPKVGLFLEIKQNNGSVGGAVIKEVEDDNITLDMNHPLAGKNLFFNIELVEIY